MKLLTRILVIVLCSFLLATAQSSPATGKRKKSSESKIDQKIVVFAHKTEHGIEYRINNESFTDKELNYALGEMHIDASKRSGVAVVLQDDMQLSDVKAIPRMAMSAGFNDVRVYVYWKATGRMAEIVFGPVMKFGLDPSKL